jgi:hypothetical protein
MPIGPSIISIQRRRLAEHPLTVSHGLRRMEQAGRLRIAEEIRPCVDVVFGQEAEVKARCLQADRGSIESPGVAS